MAVKILILLPTLQRLLINAVGEKLHGDHHAFWIDPADSKFIIDGSDGGVAISKDGGGTWRTFYDKIPSSQFYNAVYDFNKPFNIYGAVQDHMAVMGAEANIYGRQIDGIMPFVQGPGNEAGTIAVDPVDTSIVYANLIYGELTKTDLKEYFKTYEGFNRSIAIPQPADAEPLRFEWMAPTFISPHNHLTIYHASQYLFKSADSGHTWKRISPDLSYNDKSRMGTTIRQQPPGYYNY
jgi:hypothetical protein